MTSRPASFRLLWSFRICPRPPRKSSFYCREINQASGSLPDPWAFHPSVVLTEPPGIWPGRKSHYAVMSHRCMPEAIRHLQASYRSCPKKTVMAFIAAVALHHRFVPDECIFSCEGAVDFGFVTTRLLRVEFYRENGCFFIVSQATSGPKI